MSQDKGRAQLGNTIPAVFRLLITMSFEFSETGKRRWNNVGQAWKRIKHGIVEALEESELDADYPYALPRQKRASDTVASYMPYSRNKRMRRTPIRRIVRRRKTYRRKAPLRRRRGVSRRKSVYNMARRAVLKMHETKRHQVTSEETLNDAQVDRTALTNVNETAYTSNLSSLTTREGTEIAAIGIRSWIHIHNLTTEPMQVHMVWGYKTRNFSEQTKIFKNKVNMQPEQYTAAGGTYFERMMNTVGNHEFKVLKHRVFNLTENEVGSQGLDSRSVKNWLPLYHKIRYDGNLEGGSSQTHDIGLYVWCVNREGTAFTTGSGVGTDDVLQLKQEHILYFKDP